MQVDTTRFGPIEISDENCIQFPHGLPGLEEYTRFCLLSVEETEPFVWLQSLDAPAVALAAINPHMLFPDYAPKVPQSVLDEMGVADDLDVRMLTISVVPPDYERMTTNLAAPVLINTKNNQGRQVILENHDYDLRLPIFGAVQAWVTGGGAHHAGAHS